MRKTSINLEDDTLSRIEKIVAKSETFVDRSHFIRVAIDKELKLYEGAQ
jgi:metal-responsive CopG/Arc/MetJ family transcriptional regulator